MSEIIVSHALNAGPQVLWYPHLAAELGAEGHRVTVPELPEPGAPVAGPWLKTISEAVAGVRPAETVLVGHSLGGVNLLRLLEQHDTETRGAFAGVVLVATMSHEVGYDVLQPFFEGGFDWARIRRAAGQVRLLVAADDPVLVPDVFGHIRDLVTELGATARVRPEGGHLPNWTPDELPDLALPEVAALVREILRG